MNVPYPLPTRQPHTGDKVKQLFQAAGVAVADWARSNAYEPRIVYMVINGQFKGHRGRAHEIAVKLGLKVAVPDLATTAPPRSATAQLAA